jgi:CRP-like cAMP-binding protein
MDYTKLIFTPVFKGLDANEIEEILTQTHFRIKKYFPGAVIALSGDTVSSLNIVLSGTVKGEMIDFAGRVIKIEEITAPGAIAAGFLFGEKNRFPVNVISLTKTELLLVEKADFVRLLHQSDKVMVNFLNMVSNRSQFLSEKIRFLTFKTIRAKLAHYILQESGKTKSVVILNKTQSDLAEMFGVARPSIARTLSEMERDGYLQADRKIIRILDMEGLAALTTDY